MGYVGLPRSAGESNNHSNTDDGSSEKNKKKEQLMNKLQADFVERQKRAKESVRPKTINWFLLSPLLFAPALPLIRITLRHRPKLMTGLFRATLATAFLHSSLLAAGFYNIDQEEERKKIETIGS